MFELTWANLPLLAIVVPVGILGFRAVVRIIML